MERLSVIVLYHGNKKELFQKKFITSVEEIKHIIDTIKQEQQIIYYFDIEEDKKSNSIIGRKRILGASGIVFMLIVLSACVNIVDDKIPLTLVLIILFYIIDEVKDLRKKDNIAHYGHIAGALCGGLFGFLCVNQAFMESFRNIINNIIG